MVLSLIIIMLIFINYTFHIYLFSKKVQLVQVSYKRPIDYADRWNRNPLYSKFKIIRPVFREKTNLLIIVSSAPKRSDRRSAVRETWWKDCMSNDQVQQQIF